MKAAALHGDDAFSSLALYFLTRFMLQHFLNCPFFFNLSVSNTQSFVLLSSELELFHHSERNMEEMEVRVCRSILIQLYLKPPSRVRVAAK